MFSDVKGSWNSIGSHIENINEQISIQDKLTGFLDHIDHIETYVHRRLPTLEEYDSYR